MRRRGEEDEIESLGQSRRREDVTLRQDARNVATQVRRQGTLQHKSGRQEGCNASQDAQDARDAENTSRASGCNADESEAGCVFADVYCNKGFQVYAKSC